MACSKLNESRTPQTLWGEVLHTVVDILNKAHAYVNNDKTPYELWYSKHKIDKNLRIFINKCLKKKNDDNLEKFESRVREGILLGYFSKRKGYKCYNKRIQKIV